MTKTILALLGALTASASAQNWKCSAPGLVSGSYSGGDTAYIHPTSFSNGSNYPVAKKGEVANGVTKNGTRFTCRAS